MADTVHIASADPTWPAKFEAAANELRAIFGTRLKGIEHVGSTAVSGLAAKPVIDLLVGVASMEEVLATPALLVDKGWEFPASINDKLFDRRFGKKVPNGQRTHHVHIVVWGGAEWKRLVTFRDALRADPALAERYEELKRDLAVKYKDQRERYTAAKTDFIFAVLERFGLKR